MDRVLETERLILRPWKDSDAQDLYKYASDPAIGDGAGFSPHRSADDSLNIIRNVLNRSEAYAVCLKEDGRPIGAVELMLNGADDECELGYWVAKPFWGRGIIPEACRELLRRAFEDLGKNRIWCGYYDGNENSRHVQEKLGFKYQFTKDGVDVPQLGEIRCEHISCITKEEWENENTRI
jgi:RimJ/RimL family protein N-acetyltransferase